MGTAGNYKDKPGDGLAPGGEAGPEGPPTTPLQGRAGQDDDPPTTPLHASAGPVKVLETVMVGGASAAGGMAGDGVPGDGVSGGSAAGSAGGSAGGRDAGMHAGGNPGQADNPGEAGKPGDGGKPDDVVPKTRRQSEGAPAPVIPEFCTPAMFLRTVVLVHLGALAMLAASSSLWFDMHRLVDTLFYLLSTLEPALLIGMLALCLARRTVNGLRQRYQWFWGLLIPAVIAGGTQMVIGNMLRAGTSSPGEHWPPLWQEVLATALCAVLVAGGVYRYFRLRGRAYAPSFHEARLQALQARIRPHFLFNSLNTVLGLIRTNPKLAESTLENLADLFRVFMRDARELVPLDDEVLTCREYLAIEKLRLAPRLEVRWQIDGMPGDALIPSLLLQPLLENAVHHGIEPRTDTGVLNICITLVGERVRVEIDNPLSATGASRRGNQMALSNVRERLELQYDMAAELRTGPQGDRYHVLLEFPYRKERRRRDVRRHFNPDR